MKESRQATNIFLSLKLLKSKLLTMAYTAAWPGLCLPLQIHLTPAPSCSFLPSYIHCLPLCSLNTPYWLPPQRSYSSLSLKALLAGFSSLFQSQINSLLLRDTLLMSYLVFPPPSATLYPSALFCSKYLLFHLFTCLSSISPNPVNSVAAAHHCIPSLEQTQATRRFLKIFIEFHT